MIYAPKKFRGLALMRATWEAYIQHINICNTLIHIDDPYIHLVRNLENEKVFALSKLDLSCPDANNWSGRHIRGELRHQAFKKWTSHTLRGKGVIVYSEVPKANSWVSNKKGLSSSEWTNALKMSANISAVRAIPGRSFSTTRCRFPECSEKETLGHVLGSCPKSELLINNRHHKVRSSLASSLKSVGWEVYEEVHCISCDDSTRRADIIAISRREDKAVVIDPTIRFERDLQQAEEVDMEKKSIYEPCIPYLANKYNVDTKNWSVIGLLFGSRGGVPKLTWTNLKILKIPQNWLHDTVIGIIKDSLKILHHHLYFL